MIALRDQLPLVQFEDGRIELFDASWLVKSIEQAARKAGYTHWWIAEHVTQSLVSFLTLRYERTVVPIQQLHEAVHSILHVIGYAEVASHFVPTPPPLKISLLELAREAGHGYELAFFDKLNRTLSGVLSSHHSRIELLELECCVKQLRTKKAWSRDCEVLRNEIVCFVREQFRSFSSRELYFSVS